MGNAGKMALSGASAGATIGSTVMPGWGTAIGAIVGAGAGYFSGKKADEGLNGAQNKIDAAKKLMPAEIDPEVLALKRGYDRMAKSYAGRAGSEYMKNNLTSTTQNAINQAFRYSGGNFDVSQLKDIYHKGLFGINQQNQTAQLASMERAGALQEAISQRKVDVQYAKYNQELAEAVSEKQAVNANLMGALATTDFSGLKDDFSPVRKSIKGAINNTGSESVDDGISIDSSNNDYASYLPNTFSKGNALTNSSLTGNKFINPKNNYANKYFNQPFGNPFNKGNALTNSKLK